MLNLKHIGAFLTAGKLWEKPLKQFDRQEIERLAEVFVEATEHGQRQGWKPPFIDARGDLVIPFSAPAKYRWWAGGQDVLQTLNELGAPAEIVAKYTPTGYREGIPKP